MVNLRNSDGRSLYFADRKEYYRRLRISQALIKRFKEKAELKIGKIHRQSVAYTTNEGTETGLTYRAELYTKMPSRNQEERLRRFLERKISNDDVWTYVGFENEPVGSNDIPKNIQLNKIIFSVDK